VKDLPVPARLFVGAVLASGTVTLVVFAPRTIANPVLFAFLLACSSLASALKVSLPLASSGSTMSVSYAVDFAALLLLGADQTMIVAAASAWSQCTFRTQARTATYRTLFSMASLVLTVKAAGWAFTLLGGTFAVPFTLLSITKPLVGAATTYFVFNTLLIATAIGLSTRQRIMRVWNENFLWSAPSYFVGALAAAIAASVIDRGGYWMASLAAAPLYLTYRTYKVYMGRIQDQQRHVAQVSDLHLATIEALALAIDAKDQTAQSHIRRVQVYAAGLARALGMPETEIQGVKTAALLHDIGKLAVPEHILSKPGPLTQEEFQKIRIHPQVGAEIISGVPFPYPVAPLILSHHERWDGKGYPSGLAGEAIPLGARILSVVDYFDALMSERPYHKAMSLDAAIGPLRQESTKALDPRVVQTFIDMYPTLAAEADASAEPSRKLTRVPTHAPTAAPAVGLVDESSPSARTNVFQDIALAHREIYALYEIAQAMGSSLGVSDTMALISSKLSNIVPFSCCALFLYNDEAETLRCRFATGVEAETIQQLTIRNGHGLAGWVARNRRPLVNARPSTDLEAAGFPSDRTTLHSALVCPLLFNERFIGTISVYHTEPSIYTDDHRRLLDRISEQAAAVIYNSIVFEQTQEDSLTDPLTGLPNTRFIFLHLTRELARAERVKAEVSLLVMDLDNFKDINDTYGHHVGDRALRDVAGVLRAGIRPYDICVRYAGDEFIVVLSGCGGEEAEAKRLELQRDVDGMKFEARPGKLLPLAVSIGAAVFPHDGDSYETLLANADGRMYRDKTRRKREAGVANPSDEHARPALLENVTALDLKRAATGVL
jgi:diguanylate cyclase (GGDEF)-like protein/putative nucleotidyltransferase with HDIG domain